MHDGGETIEFEAIRGVIERIAHYKREHYALLKEKEAMTLLELDLWKANLLHRIEEHSFEEEQPSMKAKISEEERGEASTNGAITKEAAKVDVERLLSQRHVSPVVPTLLSMMCCLSLMMMMCPLFLNHHNV